MGHSIAPDVELPVIMLELLDLYHAHDAARLAALYTDDCKFAFPGFVAHGRKEIEATWSAWFTAFPDVESDIFRAPSTPGTVALEWEERGTHLGRLKVAGYNMHPSGRRLCWRGVSIYRLSERGITSVDYHADRLTLTMQLMTLRSLPANIPQFLRLLREARQN